MQFENIPESDEVEQLRKASEIAEAVCLAAMRERDIANYRFEMAAAIERAAELLDICLTLRTKPSKITIGYAFEAILSLERRFQWLANMPHTILETF